MPVLEAGLVGLPVFCSDRVPAAQEIGGNDVISFSPEADPEVIADLILDWVKNSPLYRLRRRVRERLLWRKIFRHEIQKLLERGPI